MNKPQTEPTAPADFISLYLRYTSHTECPTFYHRWCAITCLSAYLGRSIHYKFGHSRLYPNLYTMLIGSPGTKKSTAIKIGAKLLKQAGYNTFAAKKTRQEKFLLDMAEQSERLAARLAGAMGDNSDVGYDLLDENLFGECDLDEAEHYSDKPPAECFIAADEFNTFIGIGNMDFISILGDLWDYEGVYDYKLKNSKSVFIPEPTIAILGGNTPVGFAAAFPPESVGQGFFSRLLLIYGEPTGVKIFPLPEPDMVIRDELIDSLHSIKKLTGEITESPEATKLITKIYNNDKPLEDVRFEHYSNRRLTHLLKLCLVIVASRLSTVIETSDVIEANTLLTFTEGLMPKALGEFGKSRNSAVTHKIMTAINNAPMPLEFRSIWKLVHQDIDNRNTLVEILGNLTVADKIQVIDGGGYLPKIQVRSEGVAGATDMNLLTKAERDMI